jgi:hypothetical protein
MAQLFVPIFNLAFDLPCDEAPAETCEVAPCCQAETSTRMTCCDVQASPVRSESTPAAPAIPFRIYFDLAAPICFAEVCSEIGWTAKPDYIFSSLNTHFASNQLYKLLATFLI